MSHIQKSILSLLVLSLLILSSCKYGKVTPGNSAPDSTNKLIGSDAVISIQTVKSASLDTCAQCHSGRFEPSLSSNSDIKNNIESILSEVNSDRMPDSPFSPLTACQKSLLNTWAAMGMPDTTDVKVATLDGCKSEQPAPPPVVMPPHDLPPTQPPVAEPPADEDEIIGLNLVKNAVLNSCTKCHSEGRKKPTLESDADIKTHIDKVAKSINTDRMPPKHPLGACEKAVLNRWIELGTPDTSDVKLSSLPACAAVMDPPVLPPPPEVVPISLMPLTYETVNKQVFEKKCNSCHGGDGDANWLSFSPYDQVQVNSDLFQKPGVNSIVVLTMSGGSMPPADSGFDQVTKEEQDFIVRWIDAGMPQ